MRRPRLGREQRAVAKDLVAGHADVVARCVPRQVHLRRVDRGRGEVRRNRRRLVVHRRLGRDGGRIAQARDVPGRVARTDLVAVGGGGAGRWCRRRSCRCRSPSRVAIRRGTPDSRVTPTLSVEAVQLRSTRVWLIAVPTRLDGVDGGCPSPAWLTVSSSCGRSVVSVNSRAWRSTPSVEVCASRKL